MNVIESLDQFSSTKTKFQVESSNKLDWCPKVAIHIEQGYCKSYCQVQGCEWRKE